MITFDQGTLYLIPSPLGEKGMHTIGEYFKPIVFSLNHFIVENEKTARWYLKSLGYPHALNDLELFVLNEHNANKSNQLLQIIAPLKRGISMGLLSESGCPAVADPGATVVAMCHELDIRVSPFVGPSSIVLALMASGMNGQHFAFVGYLPVKQHERKKKIQQLEQHSARTGQTQIFIEAPYRNNQLMKELITVCKEETKICIAMDLTLPTEYVKTRTVWQWKKHLPDLNKHVVVFLMAA